MYVASVKGDLEAYLFSSGVRTLVRSIWWIVVGFITSKAKPMNFEV